MTSAFGGITSRLAFTANARLRTGNPCGEISYGTTLMGGMKMKKCLVAFAGIVLFSTSAHAAETLGTDVVKKLLADYTLHGVRVNSIAVVLP